MARKKTSITLDNNTLKDLDEMAKDSRRSRSGMIGFLVDLFKVITGSETMGLDEEDTRHEESES